MILWGITPIGNIYHPLSQTCSIKLGKLDDSLSVPVVHGESELGLNTWLESRD